MKVSELRLIIQDCDPDFEVTIEVQSVNNSPNAKIFAVYKYEDLYGYSETPKNEIVLRG